MRKHRGLRTFYVISTIKAFCKRKKHFARTMVKSNRALCLSFWYNVGKEGGTGHGKGGRNRKSGF